MNTSKHLWNGMKYVQWQKKKLTVVYLFFTTAIWPLIFKDSPTPIPHSPRTHTKPNKKQKSFFSFWLHHQVKGTHQQEQHHPTLWMQCFYVHSVWCNGELMPNKVTKSYFSSVQGILCVWPEVPESDIYAFQTHPRDWHNQGKKKSKQQQQKSKKQNKTKQKNKKPQSPSKSIFLSRLRFLA